MQVAVVGHVEWVEFARVDHVPEPGEIVHALETWQEPAGGGAVAAVQLARLAGECLFLTALGDDDLGHRSVRELEELGVRVETAWRPEPQRRAFVHVDAVAERTITVIGERMGPHGDDPLPWEELGDADAVYFTAGDEEAVRKARGALWRHLHDRARTLRSVCRVERKEARAGGGPPSSSPGRPCWRTAAAGNRAPGGRGRPGRRLHCYPRGAGCLPSLTSRFMRLSPRQISRE